MNNNLRKAAQAALGALEARCGMSADERCPDGAITVLRAALAEPQPEPVARIDPMQNPMRPSYFVADAIGEHPAEQVLRALACWLGVGGYNAPTVDAKAFHRKIVGGVQQLMKSSAPPQAQQPDMRHLKIQALIGSNARKDIEMGLVEQLLEDPNCGLTCMDMEYWNTTHDKLREKLQAQRQPLTREQIDRIWSAQGSFTDRESDYRCFARAIEAAHGIGKVD